MKQTFHILILLVCFTCLPAVSIAQADVADWTFQYNLDAMRVSFSTATHGIACSEQGSKMTTDGGVNWSPMSGISSLLFDAVSPSAQHVIAISTTNIYVSYDGGSTFVSDGTALNHQLNSLFFLDDNRGWTAGDDGFMQISVNGGSTWNLVVASNISANLTSVAFTSSTHGCLGTSAGTLYYSTNGGNSWTQGSTPGTLTSDYTITGIKYLSSTNVIASGASTSAKTGIILRSTDGGVSWSQVHTNSSETLWDVDFKDALTGYAVGYLTSPRNSQGPSLIYKTTDGGQTWTQLNFNSINGCDLYGITFYDSTHGWIVGQGGCVYTYTPPADTTTSGLSNVLPQSEISVYPNPTQGSLHIASSITNGRSCTYKILDVAGKEVLTGSVSNTTFDIDVNQLAGGMYFIKLYAGNDIVTKKFLRE